MMIRAPLLDVLDDAMAVRRAAEQQDRYYGHIAIDRHLTLFSTGSGPVAVRT